MAETFWPSLYPVVTEEAGTRSGTHSGIDLAANRGDPVLAPFAGQVVFAGGDGAVAPMWLGDRWLYPKGEGLTVDVRRDDGTGLSGLISRTGHMDSFAVAKGDWVLPGQCLGYAGDTGYSTGVHIHWETRWDRAWTGGSWINPRELQPTVYVTSVPTLILPEEDEMNMYFKPNGNSSPIMEKDGVERSRIWAGERKIGGVTHAPVWERSPDGTVRRLFKQEWDAIQAAYKVSGRVLPLVEDIGGNAVEQMIYGKRA